MTVHRITTPWFCAVVRVRDDLGTIDEVLECSVSPIVGWSLWLLEQSLKSGTWAAFRHAAVSIEPAVPDLSEEMSNDPSH